MPALRVVGDKQKEVRAYREPSPRVSIGGERNFPGETPAARSPHGETPNAAGSPKGCASQQPRLPLRAPPQSSPSFLQAAKHSLAAKGEQIVFRDCAEAFKSGLATSGVYTLTFPNSTQETKVRRPRPPTSLLAWPAAHSGRGPQAPHPRPGRRSQLRAGHRWPWPPAANVGTLARPPVPRSSPWAQSHTVGCLA